MFHVQKFEISPHDRFFLHGYDPWTRDKYEVCQHLGNICKLEVVFGRRVGNIHFVTKNKFVLDIMCQLFENICQLNNYVGIGYIRPTLGR